MRRLIWITLALLAASALTIPWQHRPDRLFRKLTRRSPQPRRQIPASELIPDEPDLAEAPSVVRQLLDALEHSRGPMLLCYSPFARRGVVEPVPPLGVTLDGFHAVIVHSDHRPEISRAMEHDQLPDRLRVY